MTTGKGVLRLAIESFFNDTMFGKWITAWYTQLAEHIEAGIIGEIGDTFDAFKETPRLAKIFNLGKFGSSDGKHQGGLLGLGGMMAGLGSGAASSLFAPEFRLLNYFTDRGLRSSRLDPSIAIQAFFRDPSLKELLENDLADLGWDASRIKALTEISHPRLSEVQLVNLVLRKELSLDQFKDEMTKRGYLPADIEGMTKLFTQLPNVQDIIRMAVREAFSPDVVKRFGYDVEFPSAILDFTRQLGIADVWVLRYWYAHWELPSPSQAYEMYHRLRPGRTDNPFTLDDLRLLLKTADYPQYFRDRLAEVAEAVYTRVDIRRMYQFGILNKDEVYEATRDLGYNETRAKHLTDYVIQAIDEPELSKTGKKKVLTQATILKLFSKGIIDEVELIDRLTALGYPGDEVEFIVTLAKLDRSADKAIDYRIEYVRDIKNLAEQEYVMGFIDKGTASELLSSINMGSADIEDALKVAEYKANAGKLDNLIGAVREAYLTNSIDYQGVIAIMGKMDLTGEAVSRYTSEWDEVKNIRGKPLTEAMYRKAWANAIITKDQYIDYLKGLGYSDSSIDLLVKMYEPGNDEEE